MKKKLVIFDLDGTLADTIYSIRDAVNMAMHKYGFEQRSYEQIRCAIGSGARELIRLSLPEHLGEDSALIERVLADYNDMYARTYSNIDGCYAGVAEAVRTLRARGYIIAVLSNKQDAYVKKIIKILFPNGEISLAEGQTELPKKPDPTVPLMIARSFSVDALDCAFVGDSDVDVKTAKNAGMTAVACSWGYRSREELADADFIVDNAEQLLALLE